MKRYAVIGRPIYKSLSPLIHAAFAEQCGVALSYQRLDVSPDDFAGRIAELHAEGYAGLNITVPHKVTAFGLCESTSPAAAQVSSVNTLIRRQSGWHGELTDGIGLVKDLNRLGIGIGGRRVLVLGSGGAGRALLVPLLAAGPAELVISNRTPWKPEELAASLSSLGPIRACANLALKGDHFDLVINATSAGHAGGAAQLPGGLFASAAVAYDLSYGAAAGPFLTWATRQGARLSIDGLGTLVEQAAEAFYHWHGVRPEVPPVLTAIRAMADASS